MSTIADEVAKRKITEVLHFTTNHGLTGTLASGAVLSREQLPESKYLEHVYAPNAAVRKDHRHLDYVNLSISRLNTDFFSATRPAGTPRRTCGGAGSRSTQASWSMRGCCSRPPTTSTPAAAAGRAFNGLAAMFEPVVERWVGNYARRVPDMPDSWTTCHQAEVLYPRFLSVRDLTAVYVATGPHADIAASTCEVLLPADQHDESGTSTVPVIVDPDVFIA